MPSAQPHLASWERRLLAAAIDGSLLLVIALFASAVFGGPGVSRETLGFTLACAYVVYHSASLLNPMYSLGRTVAGIVVLPFNKKELSASQSIARPLVRISLLVAGFVAGSILSAEWLVAVPIAFELALMAHTPWRRTVADLVVGTVVVNRPPLQPHRAPAYPMYSEQDEEFGPKP